MSEEGQRALPVATPDPVVLAKVRRLQEDVVALDDLRIELSGLFAQYESSSGDERRLAWERVLRRGSTYGDMLDAVVTQSVSLRRRH